MSLSREDFIIANRTTFQAEMEQAVGKPIRDRVTRAHLIEDIPKVSIDTKKVSQNQIRGKSSTYIPASH